MMQTDNELLKQWISKADNDLLAAKILLQANPIILDIACFHCQQAVEKYLKTFLIFRDIDFAYTHNLDYLLQCCKEVDATFPVYDFKTLGLFAVTARYPHDAIAPELAEAKEFYLLASVVKTAVLERIQIL